MASVTIDRSGTGIATVTIDRQKQLNALDDATVQSIREVFEEISNDTSVRVVILTGAGDRAFVAGADIQQLADQDAIEARERALKGQAAFNAIERCGKPVIAMINGFALGGGCELALACHLRYASAKAKIGLPEVTLGIIPGYGGTQRLQRIIGRGRALELILTGEHISADKAYELGLVNQVFSPDELEAGVQSVAETLCKRGPKALDHAIDAVIRGGDGTLADGLAIEADLFGVTSATKDMKEGMAAFLEKRSPNFEGK
ncbi:MAG: enoyl-CoA hydratase/isomerase family protein [Planctomycetia bacterium]|nr:enoyl-CoA hydratase/isomerase family protein [Planctomycetia bacterium]MBL6915319.1 enoyl-CoA hydratase/isomerase family protein [Planctomycetota bacterium]MDG2084930.1 enoyl-CoA hydratase-related protein [Planctomycetota bacterium]HCW44114.1 enoyl-CoA hydratase [Planctomycetota bacterium]